MEKIPMIKIIFGSIGVCLALVILSGVLVASSGTRGIVLSAVLVLCFIEEARQQMAKKIRYWFMEVYGVNNAAFRFAFWSTCLVFY